MSLRDKLLAASRKTRTVKINGESFEVSELSAFDRVQVVDLIQSVSDGGSVKASEDLFIRGFVIASALDEFDQFNNDDVASICKMGPGPFSDLFTAACELSGLDFLLGKTEAKN